MGQSLIRSSSQMLMTVFRRFYRKKKYRRSMKRLGPLNLFLFDEYWINKILILWIYSLYIISVNLMTIVFNQEIFSIRNFHYDDEIYMYFKVVKPHKDNITICNYVEILQHIWFDFFTALCCWKRCLSKTSKRDWEKRQRNRISSNIHEEIRGYFDIIRIFFIVIIMFLNLHETFTIKFFVSINAFRFEFYKVFNFFFLI